MRGQIKRPPFRPLMAQHFLKDVLFVQASAHMVVSSGLRCQSQGDVADFLQHAEFVCCWSFSRGCFYAASRPAIRYPITTPALLH